jgi:hypothetical protein
MDFATEGLRRARCLHSQTAESGLMPVRRFDRPSKSVCTGPIVRPIPNVHRSTLWEVTAVQRRINPSGRSKGWNFA